MGIPFGTKAATLRALQSRVRHSVVCECCIFTVNEWRGDPGLIVNRIRKQFNPERIIVRSSALNEDGEAHSMAGAYHSVKDVDSTSRDAVADAVNKVIASYGADHPDGNEILVQPMIADVSMSGVVFSHDLSTGAPYYVINYDDETGLTDTVTSGTTDTSRTLLIHRQHVDRLQSPRFRALLRSVQEIESLTDLPGVDLEFAVTRDERIFVFQVRRLAVSQNWNRHVAQKVDDSLPEIGRFLEGRFRPTPGILGDSSVFGEMPDWNPAEMIGAVPRPLARSLYQYLITDSIWAEARAEMGYRDLSGRPLLVNLGGRVYVDVRESFNSFLPATLPDSIGEKLVGGWLARLKAHPELHDKIEFEVAVTAHTLDLDERIAPVRHLLTEQELGVFRQSLCRLTNDIVLGRSGEVATQRRRIAELDERRRQLQGLSGGPDKLHLVRELLRDCAARGTRAFAVMARRAFVAEALLRSIESKGILPAPTLAAFRASVPTVLTEFLHALHACQSGGSGWDHFMQVYGHLRPGTYDILASRYDQHEELRDLALPGPAVAPQPVRAFAAIPAQLRALDRALAEAGFEFDAQTLLAFMREAIAGREYAKLVFTRNVSDTLELIAAWGIENGLSRDELSYLTITQILDSLASSFQRPAEAHYRDMVSGIRQAYAVGQALRLPYLITHPSDIYVIPLLKSRANFITSKRVQAPLHFLSDHALQSSRCAGRVVLIERADPGYDWIFLSPIAGLVTKYGGSNSHMAIRCAELDIPAAIGCGEQTFEQLQKSGSVLLDCAAGLLVPIR
jgi:phosphohistidine swiveling domain-containing protein